MKTFDQLLQSPPATEVGAPYVCLDEGAYNQIVVESARRALFLADVVADVACGGNSFLPCQGAAAIRNLRADYKLLDRLTGKLPPMDKPK